MAAEATTFRAVNPADVDAVRDFVAGIGAADRTFLDQQLLDPDRIASWAADPESAGLATTEGDRVAGLGSIRPGTGWSSHVGLLRLVVSPAERGRGIGAGDAAIATWAARSARVSAHQPNEPPTIGPPPRAEVAIPRSRGARRRGRRRRRDL